MSDANKARVKQYLSLAEMDACKHGNTAPCSLCKHEDEEHDAAMAAQAIDDRQLLEASRLHSKELADGKAPDVAARSPAQREYEIWTETPQ